MKKILVFILAAGISTAFLYLSQQDFNNNLPNATDWLVYTGVALAYGGLGVLLLKRMPEAIGLAVGIILTSGILGILFATEVSTFLLATSVTLVLGLPMAAIGAGIRYIATYDRSAT